MNEEKPPEAFFDGRKNFHADDEVERRLEEHFDRFQVSRREIWRNFAAYSRRTFLKRFLAHYELFRMIIDLPGDIAELGVYRGTTLMTWANFMEIRHMGDRQRRIFGFDNFTGFGDLDAKDGREDDTVQKAPGGFQGPVLEQLLDMIDIFDKDRFIPYKPRVVIVPGDIEETVPKFVQDNPGVRLALLHFDADLYRPTKVGLEHLWPLVVPGGVVLFDEYGIPPWEGESRAVDEFLEGKNLRLRRFDWCPNPGAYLIKENN